MAMWWYKVSHVKVSDRIQTTIILILFLDAEYVIYMGTALCIVEALSHCT